ncbi:hypothetical protein OQH60_08405 [Campylobacter sp. MIT 21-1685]|uniref:hypothetical protein n=1 Tax=unclassified Campylobacter TaxID=2593542 RepID=UPI00224B68D8|nr:MULTISPECIES: hypothetical protein [unclassified Campylobacter]MCX2683876.1 hypothetical protein [Campylobacter sp. MIT 21-1684]MCX2752160.1 hypothetical protein [Campylobacter sp. MIT 21-1682]MCX2808354.1 hypothetical protein [Campylobacter sp. MIT 21-1685]
MDNWLEDENVTEFVLLSGGVYDGENERKEKKDTGEDLSEIQVVGKDIDISLVSEYSRNILRRIGKDSNNPVITITDIARTPPDQAREMYKMCNQKDGISKARQTYKLQVHSVIDIYENLNRQNKSENEIKNAMEQEIRRLIPKGYFQHCQDYKVKNTFDVSVWRLKNSANFFKVARQYENTHQGFKIIDERRNAEKCYHIEITQP